MQLFRPSLWIGVVIFAGCGGRAEDTTVIDVPARGTDSMDPTQSAALQALAQPAARDAFCGWVGASAAGVAGPAGNPLDCSSLVARCRAAAASMGTAGPVAVPGLLGAADLSGVLGCPVSFAELDACVAELVDWVVARYPDGPGCAMSTPIQPPGLQDLSMLSSCVVVAADCPALLEQLLATRGLGG